jgi:MFS family permease
MTAAGARRLIWIKPEARLIVLRRGPVSGGFRALDRCQWGRYRVAIKARPVEGWPAEPEDGTPVMHASVDLRSGDQRRALWLSTIAFTVCFAVWTIFSIVGVQIKKDLSLTDTQFGLLVGTPILTGAVVRVLLGIWTDQYGGRLVFTLVMLASAAATLLLSYATTYPLMLAAALGVGIAGGSFAVGVAYVSRWYEAAKQGTALGLFGLGNVGAAVTHFTAPLVMLGFGWQTVARVWALALAATAVAFWLIARDDPFTAARRQGKATPVPLSQRLAPLKRLQVWRFSLYYFFTFGAFVALTLWLPRYYMGVYGLSLATAGLLATAFSLSGSVFRAPRSAAGCPTATARASSCIWRWVRPWPSRSWPPIRRPSTSSTESKATSASPSASASCRSSC